MGQKQKYRVKNWNEYNEALVNRGSLTVWFDEDAIEQWHETHDTFGKQGAPKIYSDIAIICALTLKSVYRLPFRAAEGFLNSIINMLNLPLSVPDYTTLCRRQSALDINLLPSELEKAKHIVIDSTGLKVYGEGEWKTRTHGISKRRTWRKLHLAINVDTHEIEASVVTTNDVHDSQVFVDLLDQISGEIDKVGADGAYDPHDCYNAVDDRGAKAIIIPRENSVIKQHGNSKQKALPRDETIREIRKKGRKKWKQMNDYHKRSLAETAMYRIKQIFGGHLSSRLFKNQAVEAFLRCRALNIMTQLGMPESELITE
jgi:IS5 family transposase